MVGEVVLVRGRRSRVGGGAPLPPSWLPWECDGTTAAVARAVGSNTGGVVVVANPRRRLAAVPAPPPPCSVGDVAVEPSTDSSPVVDISSGWTRRKVGTRCDTKRNNGFNPK